MRLLKNGDVVKLRNVNELIAEGMKSLDLEFFKQFSDSIFLVTSDEERNSSYVMVKIPADYQNSVSKFYEGHSYQVNKNILDRKVKLPFELPDNIFEL